MYANRFYAYYQYVPDLIKSGNFRKIVYERRLIFLATQIFIEIRDVGYVYFSEYTPYSIIDQNVA